MRILKISVLIRLAILKYDTKMTWLSRIALMMSSRKFLPDG